MSYFKNIFFLLVFTVSLSGCLGESSREDSNYIQDLYFNETIRLTNTQQLDLLGNQFIILENYGVEGIIVYSIDNSNLVAFDLACPHLPQNVCSVPMDYQTDWPLIACNCGDVDVYYSLGNPFGYLRTPKEGGGYNYSLYEVDGRNFNMQEYSVVLVDSQTIQIRNF